MTACVLFFCIRITSFSGIDKDFSGTIKGYVYHIKEEERKSIVRQICESISTYLNQHLDQRCKFTYEESNSKLRHRVYTSYPLTFQSLEVNKSMPESKNIFIDIVSPTLSDDTFILVADSYGDLRLPMDWYKLSKEVNGVQTLNKKLQDLPK